MEVCLELKQTNNLADERRKKVQEEIKKGKIKVSKWIKS